MCRFIGMSSPIGRGCQRRRGTTTGFVALWTRGNIVALSYLDAYSQIKELEANGTLDLPATSQTVEVGTVDAQTGDFTWSVPTIQQTYTHPVILTAVPRTGPGVVGGPSGGVGPGGGFGPG